jgi:uncharacterized membrane protein (DUF2068 family)
MLTIVDSRQLGRMPANTAQRHLLYARPELIPLKLEGLLAQNAHQGHMLVHMALHRANNARQENLTQISSKVYVYSVLQVHMETQPVLQNAHLV